MRSHYSKDELVDTLKSLGIKRGDVIFSHISLSKLGFIQGQRTPDKMVASVIDALLEVLGCEGTFLTPVYSYSYCKKEIYNNLSNCTDCGPFGKIILEYDNVIRSDDPNFSVAGFGPLVKELFLDLPLTSFGDDCLYQRLLDANVKIVNIGVNLSILTAIHHFEHTISVPYRYNKIFSGQSILNGIKKEQQWEYYVRELDIPSEADCSELQREGLINGLVKSKKIGLGEIYTVELKEYFELAKQKCMEDPWFLTVNGKWQNKEN